MNNSIQVEKKGPVTTVIISRPDVKNAIDRETANQIADAFSGERQPVADALSVIDKVFSEGRIPAPL